MTNNERQFGAAVLQLQNISLTFGGVSALLTVTVPEPGDGADSVTVAPSLTSSSNANVVPAVSDPAGMVQVSGAPALAAVPPSTVHSVAVPYVLPSTETSHVQAYGDVPVLGIVPETVND